MSGFIQVNRALWDNPDFVDSEMSQREAFMWMVAFAAWRPTKTRVGKIVVDLERGQLAFSLRFMAEKFGWSKSRVSRFLDVLEARSTIGTASGTGVSVITICNYNKYQLGGDVSGTDDGTAAGQQRDSSGTKKKTLNTLNTDIGALSASTDDDQPDPTPDKRTRRRGSRISANWTPTPKDYAFATSKGLSPEEINDEADRFRNHWSSASKNASKLDWEATWRNWITRPDFGPVARKAKQQAADARGGSTMAAALDRVADQLEFGSHPGRGGQELHRAQTYPDRASGGGEAEVIDVDGDVIARAAF